MTTPTVHTRSLAQLALEARWREDGIVHSARHHFDRFNVWRDLDLLPPALHGEVLGRTAGHRARRGFAGCELVPEWQAGALRRLAPHRFRDRTRRGVPVAPARGRYYPQGLAEGLSGVFSESTEPMRLVELAPDHLTLDFNHPLARGELALGVEVLGVQENTQEHGGLCNDCIAELLKGPGMQMRDGDRPTDFFSGDPFRRVDDQADGLFYALPRMVPHLDRAALGEVAALYGRLLASRTRVLDLMASWDSHLPDGLDVGELIGLGLNREELAANPRLTERLVRDLNADPTLPFPDASLDAVVCTVSVEYLTRPFEVFREVARVLAPGGVFVNTFSNRWFPTKTIALWPDLHEFERLGLVSEYYRKTPGLERLHTLSQRGLPRPADDPHGGQTSVSDPLYAVWGYRAGTP